MREGLLALAVGTGLQMMQPLMEGDVTAAAGPKGKHDPGRAAVRHGHERGSVTLGGRRVPVSRPRVRAADGTGELPVPAYELFTGTEILGSMAMDRMLAGLSTRRYPVGLEPVGAQVTASARSTSKSAVSRKFVAATETALAQLLAADLSALDLIALMIDGVHFGESVCIVALGIDADGVKRPLALVEGATENATVVTDLLTGLRERGLDVTRPILVGLTSDGPRRLGLTRGELIESDSRSYPRTAAWARALHDHWQRVDGLLWASGQRDTGRALLLFGDRVKVSELALAPGAGSAPPRRRRGAAGGLRRRQPRRPHPLRPHPLRPHLTPARSQRRPLTAAAVRGTTARTSGSRTGRDLPCSVMSSAVRKQVGLHRVKQPHGGVDPRVGLPAGHRGASPMTA